MISKKSRKVVAALLIGATVCASGTFAYFNNKLDLSNVVDNTDASNLLNITNGHVEVIGEIKGQQSAGTSIWSYDVSRLSTLESINADESFKTAITKKYTSLGTITENSGIIALKSTDTYVSDNLSPDILGVETEGITKQATPEATTSFYENLKTLQDDLVEKQSDLKDAQDAFDLSKPADANYNILKTALEKAQTDLETAEANLNAKTRSALGKANDKTLDESRAKVGDPIVNYISYARPGDAFVLGTLKDDGKEAEGLLIKNKSNIVTKIGLTPKDTGSATTASMDKAKAQLKLLEDAGYKFYIKTSRLNADDVEVDLETGNNIDDVTYLKSDYKQLKSTTISAGDYTGILLSDVKPGETLKINIRIELPLDATNHYQDKNTISNDITTGFDVTDLFDVVVTQENNPGWNENGTENIPVSDSASKNPTF